MEKRYVDLKEYLPQFSLEERGRRWATVCEEMRLNDLDCLLFKGTDFSVMKMASGPLSPFSYY